MKKVLNFVKGKKEDRRDRITNNSNISVEITNPFGQSVASEDEHVIGLLSGYGYNVDLSGRDKSVTKLHKAAWQGNLEKVKLNLKKFDINIVDEYNRTPLHLAASQGHTNIVRFLLNNRAILDISDNDGMSPFLKAVECGVKECVSLLLERGANISTIDNHGNTAVHITAKQGFFNIMSLLIKRRANFDCSNNEGKMPLHVATEQEHRDIVQLLLQTGAHVNAVDRINRTPLMLAARGGQTYIASLLLQHGASLDACDNNGWTAEDYAMIGGHEQLALDLKVPHCPPSLPATDMDDLELSCTDDLNDIPKNVLLTEEEIQESPRSCVIPPPLNPPRSWEIIQAGMIDETQVGRRSLMALGTLKSHKESFVENENGFDKQENLLMSSSNNISVRVLAEIEQEDLKGDFSDSEWCSDDSLPLDRSLPPPPDSSLESYLLVPELVITPTDRRSKINLERTHSLDLTDSEIMDSHKISAEEINFKVERKQRPEELWISNNTIKRQNNNFIVEDYPISVEKTTQLNSTQVFVKEDINDSSIIAETNNLDENENKNKVTLINLYSQHNTVDEGHYKKSELQDAQSYERLENERYCDPDHFSNFESCTNKNDLSQSVDSLEEESLIGTVVKRSAFYESHSLELLDEAKNLSHLSRNKSMSACSSHNWSKSVDMLSKPSKAESLPRDSKRIDAQLKCYDEALRELAEEQRIKENLLHKSIKSYSLPFSNYNRSISCGGANSNYQKPRMILKQKAVAKYDSKSIKDKSALSSFERTNKQIEKLNKTEVLNSNSLHQCKSSTCTNDLSSISIENSPKKTKVDSQKLMSDQESQPSSKRTSKPTISSDKHKSYKKRSCSVGSKNKRKSFESSLKLYNSLEFPPPYSKGFINMGIITSDNYTKIFKKSKEQPIQSYANQINQKHSKNDNTTFRHCEPLPDPKKSKKREKFDLSVRKKREDNEINKNMVSQSVSICTQQQNYKDLSKNQIIEGKDIVLDAKSDTDSEWSEQQLQNKRKHFLAMHRAIADSEESIDEDPPFWLSKEGCFTRQTTVIPNQNTCRPNSSEMKKDNDRETSGIEGYEEVSSSSDTGSMSVSHSEASLSHPHSLKGHQVLIKDHLKQATEEKARLEETAAKLLEQTERLQYDLADANQNIVARDDKIIILQDELTRLNMKYSASLDEMNSLKQRLMSTEIELQHIQDLLQTNK